MENEREQEKAGEMGSVFPADGGGLSAVAALFLCPGDEG